MSKEHQNRPKERLLPKKVRTSNAIEEVECLINNQFPNATFKVTKGIYPGETWLHVYQDDIDQDQLADAYLEKLSEIEDQERLFITVLLHPTPEKAFQKFLSDLKEERADIEALPPSIKRTQQHRLKRITERLAKYEPETQE